MSRFHWAFGGGTVAHPSERPPTVDPTDLRDFQCMKWVPDGRPAHGRTIDNMFHVMKGDEWQKIFLHTTDAEREMMAREAGKAKSRGAQAKRWTLDDGRIVVWRHQVVAVNVSDDEEQRNGRPVRALRRGAPRPGCKPQKRPREGGEEPKGGGTGATGHHGRGGVRRGGGRSLEEGLERLEALSGALGSAPPADMGWDGAEAAAPGEPVGEGAEGELRVPPPEIVRAVAGWAGGRYRGVGDEEVGPWGDEGGSEGGEASQDSVVGPAATLEGKLEALEALVAGLELRASLRGQAAEGGPVPGEEGTAVGPRPIPALYQPGEGLRGVDRKTGAMAAKSAAALRRSAQREPFRKLAPAAASVDRRLRRMRERALDRYGGWAGA